MIKRAFLLFFLVGTSFSVKAQEYQPNWESLDHRPIPQWYKDAKFGIFIHWGVYSVPSWAPTDVSVYAKYSEWYWKRSTDSTAEGYNQFKAFQNKAYGGNMSYQDFANDFTTTMFDPDQWAEIFAKAGAKYVVLTSKHHDGFTLWPSAQSWNWNSVDIGPHRDLAGELTEAVKSKGIHMGFYYSLYEWFNPLYKNDISKYVDNHMIPQMKDLVKRYEPDILWTDGEWDHNSKVWKSEQFLAWLYNNSPVKKNIVVNDRWGKETRSKHGGIYITEYNLIEGNKKSGDSAVKHKWEEVRGIGGSFGYNRNERLEHYSTAQELIQILIKTVSNGGNLLLDVGGTSDGRIPVIMEQRLMEIGNWLKVNGEAIYSSNVWWDNPNIKDTTLFYTIKNKNLYVISTKWPKKELVIKGLNVSKNVVVELLGLNKKIITENKKGGFHIKMPVITPDEIPNPYGYVFKISHAMQ